MGCLYKIDFANGKSYVGITRQTAERRFKQHMSNRKKDAKKSILYNALRKYKSHDYVLRTLVISDDYEYLKFIEKRAIQVFGTLYPAGYNLTEGGEGTVGYKLSEESKKRIGELSKGNSYAKGRKHTEEQKRKIRVARAKQIMKPHECSEEAKAKIREKTLGNKSALGFKWSVEQRTKWRLSVATKRAIKENRPFSWLKEYA
jgi:group I intron endonuclease